MAEFSRLMITDNGQALLAKIMTGSGNITFTKISSSSHSYTPEEAQSLEALSDVEQTNAISRIERTNEVAVRIETAFSNKELTSGYYMRALGLYAEDPDAGEILYAVTVETSGNCYMPAYNGVTVSGAYIQLVTTVGNAENVSLTVSEAGVATVRDVRELQEGIQQLRDGLEEGAVSICFDDYPERENIQTQDTLRTVLGKVKKWFADLGAGAFAGVANNCTTTEEGHVLDARQGTALQEQVDEINGNISNIKVNVGTDGKLHFVDSAGADTVLNFSGVTSLAVYKKSTVSSYGHNTATASVTAAAGTYMAFCCKTYLPGTNSASLYDASPSGSGFSSAKLSDFVYKITVPSSATISVSTSGNASNSTQYASITLVK